MTTLADEGAELLLEEPKLEVLAKTFPTLGCFCSIGVIGGTGVMERLYRVFLGVEGRSGVSLTTLVGEPGRAWPLTTVLGVVVEFESDSFSKLPPSSLSCKINKLPLDFKKLLAKVLQFWLVLGLQTSAGFQTPTRNLCRKVNLDQIGYSKKIVVNSACCLLELRLEVVAELMVACKPSQGPS